MGQRSPGSAAFDPHDRPSVLPPRRCFLCAVSTIPTSAFTIVHPLLGTDGLLWH
jgi:hypothetical protein